MKHEVGDEVRIIARTRNHGFDIGDIVTIREMSAISYEGNSPGRVGYYFSEEDCEKAILECSLNNLKI